MFFGLFWVACAMALVNPIWGVVTYMLVYQIHPPDTWWGMPLTALGLRFSMLAAVFTLLGMFTGRKHVPEVRPAFTAWEWGVLALVVIAAMNLAIGVGSGPRTLQMFEKLWKVLLFVLILGRLATTRHNLRLVVWALVVGSLYVGYDAFTAPSSSFWLGRLEQIGGPDFSTTSGAAAYMAAMLPIVGTAFLIARRWRWRLLACVSGVLLINAIILCRTRSAFVGLLFGALSAVMVTPRVRRYRIYLLLIIGAAGAFSLTDDYFLDRMGTLTDKQALAEDPAAVTRTEIWWISLRILSDHPLGIGTGNFTKVVGLYSPEHYKRATHNTLITCFVELGIQGGIVFVLMIMGSVRMLYRSARMAHLSDDPVETRMLAFGFFVSLVTYFVTALGTRRFYCESFWWILVLPLCLHRVVNREAVAEVEVPQLARLRDTRIDGALLGPV